MNRLNSLNDRVAVAHAIEENAARLLLAMGRAGGGEEYQDAHIHWTIGGSPIDYHNAVVRADLSIENADAAIEAVIARLREHRVPGAWHLTETMRPPDLAERLVAHGFAAAGDEPCMAVDLQRLNAGVPAPAALRIQRVRDEQALQTWASTLARGFGEGEREARWVGDVYRAIGLGDQSPFRHYLAWLDNAPAATASLFLDGSTAGIYFVMTVPELRRLGIGAAVTRAALVDAHNLGYRVGVLGASAAGYAVYRRLGFEECCRVGIYEWHLPLGF